MLESRNPCAECTPLIEEANRRATLERGNPNRLLDKVERHCGERPLVRAQVLRARGFHQRTLGLIDEAITTLTDGRDAAHEAGGQELADQITLTLGGALARAGDLEEAGRLMVEIAERRHDVIGDMARSQLGGLYSFMGNCSAGVELLDALGERLERAGEFEWAARSFSNLGWCLIEVGEPERAVTALEQARRVWTELGAHQSAGSAAHHLSAALSLLGRPIDALRALQQAWHGRDLTMDDWLDAAELYYEAGLVDDSLANGRKALAAATTPREEGLCQLALARLFVDTGRFHEGFSAATAASEAFRRAGMDELGYSADVLAVESRLRTGRATAADMELLEAQPEDLTTRSAYRARSLRAELALSLGDLDRAAALLDEGTEEQATLGLATDVHVETARAKLSHARGDIIHAIGQIAKAMRDVEESAAAIGVTDLTVGMRGLTAGLADLGLSYALESGDVESILEFADRARALDAAGRIHIGQEIESLLKDYRSQRRRAREKGAAPVSSKTEQTLRDLVRVAREAGTVPAEPAGLEQIQASLADAVMALFFETAGHTYLLSLTSAHAKIEQVGLTGELESAAAKLRTRFMATLRLGDPAEMKVVGRLTAGIGKKMLGDLPATGPIILIPPPGVYGIPWPLMPQLAGRQISVNASPSGWQKANRRDTNSDNVTVLVAGPEPPAAVEEVESLSATYPDTLALVGEDARVDRVLASIEGALRVHFATHGHARTDNPIFSTLELADGPLTLYEMQTVAPPCEVVISACSVGKARTYPGGLAVGMPNVLLAAGARSVVASELPVPDEPTRRVMIELYQRLAEGDSMARSLASTTTTLLSEDPAAGLAAAAFNVYGA